LLAKTPHNGKHGNGRVAFICALELAVLDHAIDDCERGARAADSSATVNQKFASLAPVFHLVLVLNELRRFIHKLEKFVFGLSLGHVEVSPAREVDVLD
jgi:hypothetical protein